MRRLCLFSCALFVACGPESAIENSETGASSTGAGASSGAPDEPTTGPPDTGATTDATTDVTTGDATTGDATTDATVDTTVDTTTDDTTTAAACIDTFKHDEIPEQPMTCGLPPLCPGDEPLLFEPKDNGGWSTEDIERARCMAAAMRDRTPGIFSFRHYGLNAWEDIRTIEIFASDQVIATHTENTDFNVAYTEHVGLLREPGFFEDCADGTAIAVHNCLVEGVGDACIETLRCPE